MIAAGISARISDANLKSPRAAKSPAVISSESPGRKKPMRSPVSAKMTATIP